MKKLLYFLSLTFLLFSCSNVADVKDDTTEFETLKTLINNRESVVSWTKEIEGERLKEVINRDERNIRGNISLTPEVVSIVYNKDAPIYPVLNGFGSLDTSNIPSNIKSIVEDFCKSVSENIFQGPEIYFDSNYIFNLVFFRQDLINSWHDKFEEDFPIENPFKEENLPNNSEENEENKNNNETKTDIKLQPLFSSWILGRAFIGNEILELPVRFYCQQGFVDVTLYINRENNKIYQVREEAYGRKE